MFDHLKKELDRLSVPQQVSVPIESDSDGYWDRECPSPECLFQFKILYEDWKNIVRDEEVFCPSCRHAAPAKSWFTTAQVEAARKYAFGTVVNRVNSAIRADADASKRRQSRSSILRITLEAKGGQDAILLPIAAAEPMRLRASCENCSCRYSYIGAAYFCPSCGENSASHTFFQTLSSIRTAAGLRGTLASSIGADEAEVVTQSLIEKGMLDAVTSFQRLCEQLYAQCTGKHPRRNAFQSLDAGSELWESAVGLSYEQMTDSASLARLRVFYQQRHLLAHQQGIVDADYIERSGDHRYVVGQRILVREREVLEFVEIIEALGSSLLERTKS
ncbi:hypothetical protein E2F49_11635 [Luteimonas terrae]|uniref:Uncharacterized protein n=2 Tax=Luteimonas terrae TaxID=1530191 RepID=A0A4R5U9P8_9GAMM|nr:hypothetical protein E2F49_11635 [Luteimonas terrae]